MNTIDSLFLLKEQLSEETFTNIEEALIQELFDRPDLIDDILKATTGKTAGQHLKSGISKLAKYAGNKLREKALKSNFVKNTIGKKEYNSAYDNLSKTQAKYDQAKQNHKNCTDDAQKRVHKEEMKFYNKEANKRAKKVNDIKQKYGL